MALSVRNDGEAGARPRLRGPRRTDGWMIQIALPLCRKELLVRVPHGVPRGHSLVKEINAICYAHARARETCANLMLRLLLLRKL